MIRFAFLQEAAEEVEAARRWYDEQENGLGDRFVAEVLACLERIGLAPEAFAVHEAPFRLHRLHRFPFGVLYHDEGAVIRIIAAMHLHRRPGYWSERL